MSKNKIRLNICGSECTITSEDNETYVLALGDEVEKSIQSIMSKNDRVSLTLASIITALSFCDEAKKAVAAADNLRSQIKDYLEDSSRSRLEADEARREIERMKQEIQTLRTRLAAGEAAAAAAAAQPAPAAPPIPAPAPAPAPARTPEPQPAEEPVRRPTPPAVPHVQTGSYSRPESRDLTPQDLDRESFMSFFEKKETD